MAAPQSSRYPRPLRATHAFSQTGSAGTGGPGQPGRRFSYGSQAPSATSPGVPVSRRGVVPPSPEGQRGTSERRGVVSALERDAELDSSRRASSLTSLADPDCCYGNPLWQRQPPTNQMEPESDTDATPSKGAEIGGYSHKRSNSCSSADSLKKTPPASSQARRNDGRVHSRKSIEGLNQEVSSVLEGKLIMPHQPPDGHVAPICELLGSVHHTPPHPLAHSSPSLSPSPYLSTPSPSLVTPTENPETPTGFSLPQGHDLHLPSSPNPSFAWEPPDGIERCRTLEHKPHTELVPTGPDKTKANIVFQGTAFLPTHRVVAINSVS